MSDLDEAIHGARPHLAFPSRQFAWQHEIERETDNDPWQHTYSGHVILRTTEQTVVLSQTFTGTDGDQLLQGCVAWGKQVIELLSKTQCAVVERKE